MCSFTWLVQIVTWPEQFISCLQLEKMMIASKLQNKRLVKYVKDMIFRVSSINICISIYLVLLSVVIEWVNMLKIIIVTAIVTQYWQWDNSELPF